MDKNDRYYGLIEELIRNHKKFNGYDEIIEDIIEDVYSHSAVVINSINNEAVVRSYLEKIISTAMITVPKKLGFSAHSKNIGNIAETIQTVESQPTPQNIIEQEKTQKIINKEEYVNVIENEAERDVIIEPQKAAPELVDKMINSMEPDFIEQIEQPPLPEQILNEESEVRMEEDFLSNEENSDFVDDIPVSENAEILIEDNSEFDLLQSEEEIESSLEGYDDNSLVIENYNEEETEDSIGLNAVESLEEDSTKYQDVIEPIDESLQVLQEEYHSTTEVNEELPELDSYESEMQTETEEFLENSDIELLEIGGEDSQNEANVNLEEFSNEETVFDSSKELSSDLQDLDADSDSLELDTTLSDKDDNIVELENSDQNIELNIDEPYSGEILIEPIDEPVENNFHEIGLEKDSNGYLQNDSNDDFQNDLYLEMENVGSVLSDVDTQPEYNNAEKIEPSEDNNIDIHEDHIITQKTDYSVFNYIPETINENFDTDEINLKLENLNNEKPELHIKDIFELKYKQNLTVKDIAIKLNVEEKDVILALDEIIELV